MIQGGMVGRNFLVSSGRNILLMLKPCNWGTGLNRFYKTYLQDGKENTNPLSCIKRLYHIRFRRKLSCFKVLTRNANESPPSVFAKPTPITNYLPRKIVSRWPCGSLSPGRPPWAWWACAESSWWPSKACSRKTGTRGQIDMSVWNGLFTQ